MSASIYEHTFDDLQKLCSEAQLPLATAKGLYNWYFKKKKTDFCQFHNFTQKAQDFVKHNFSFHLPQISTVHESQDKTVKFVFTLADQKQIETVLIPFHGKYTICLSSQVGCKMNCSFCYTGKQGYTRNLETAEIVGQFLQAQIWLSTNRPHEDKILNIVYMGQGEPLDNFTAVKKSAEIFLDQHGLSIACHKITVSTSGYLPGLLRWPEEMPNVNIALSLHSVIPEKRQELIPLEKKYPLSQILPLVDQIPKDDKRFVTYEYLLIKNFNDQEEDARLLGKTLQGKKAYINLIPFNPFPGTSYQRSDMAVVLRFKSILDEYKIPTLIRTTKGDEILAACGQLNTRFSKTEEAF